MHLTLSADDLRDIVQPIAAEIGRQVAEQLQASLTIKPAAILVTDAEAADMLSVCPKTITNLADDGKLPRIRIGRSVRFAVSDLQAFVDATKTTETQEVTT